MPEAMLHFPLTTCPQSARLKQSVLNDQQSPIYFIPELGSEQFVVDSGSRGDFAPSAHSARKLAPA
eukprot:7072363-Alexandrium_andersonii.AAC.1